MDSDASSLEDEVGINQAIQPPARNNMNDASDVSDDDNISRAARSIESPPESPQIGHFESPPPSPDYMNRPPSPDVPASPDSVHKLRSLSPDDSGSGSGSGTPSYQLPRLSSHSRRNVSPPIRSPQSPRSSSGQIQSPNSQNSVESPNARHDSPIHSPQSPYHGNESSPTMTRSDRQRFDIPSHGDQNSPRSRNSVQSPSQKSDTSVRSSNSIRSPRNGSESPQRLQNPVQSPYRRSKSPKNLSYYGRSSHRGSHSPSQPLKQEHERSNRSSKLVNENKNCPSRSYCSIRSPPSPPPEDCGSRSPDGHDTNSDDGRSNISSASSFSSLNRRSPSSLPKPRTPPPARVKTLAELKSHAEDLSDVSDLDSLGSVSDEEDVKAFSKKMENGETIIKKSNVPEVKKDLRTSTTAGLEGEETEQLDFEAEEREEGECEGVKPTSGGGSGGGGGAGGTGGGSEDEGELKGDELEEGELTDEGENRPEETEPRPICRFYNRGQCTWGANCRFVHPGVTDKGNYTMFEMVRPLVPMNGPPQIYPAVDYRPVERPMMGPHPAVMARKEELPVVESAWERGLRQAKEMLRKSSKRKETEVDFEEKKMNLTLGQDELDKENDYYTRTASPIITEETQRWSGKAEGEPKRYRSVSDRFEDYGGGPENMYFSGRGGEWQHRGHHYEEVRQHHRVMRTDTRNKYPSNTIHGYHSRVIPQQEYYERKRQKSYGSREVIVQRSDKTWKDDSPLPSKTRHAEGRSGARGDEWADPWMRSKSPLGRKAATGRSRKQSYSSGSSYSSSSSRSRSSSSSGSSYSHDSRSRSHSSRSRSHSKKPVSPARRLLRGTSPIKGKAVSPALMEKKAATERALHMNPPPPSPVTLKTNVDRSRSGGVPPRLLAHSKAAVAAAMRSARSRSKSSKSSTGSDSSGSSSDSSESSFSSSSSSRAQSPPVRQKRIVIDEKLALAQAMKVKAMDALKLSGQKQQIKLTLKGSGGIGPGVGIVPTGERVTTAVIAGKKRAAESPPESSPPKVGGKTTPKKTAPSRREELLKQLKAVEDAIARKRSKIL